ncbi:helix-turn-helix domain-containing protein [Rhizobium herbae]|uniref:Helix-turn-helix domain-containing protein n=2 Tax=Rhizobium herbae TaxID=508661 RepID=A0ABS7H6E6_9HYPH|nr:helix-turn-helix domain-containing protein [Rhizobium herbae]
MDRFEAGSTLFWEGDPAANVFEVVAGVFRIVRVLNDGRRVITGFIYAGELLGASLRDRYLYSAEAVTQVTVRRFGRNRFQEEISRQPELREQLFSRLSDELAAAQDQMVLLSRKNAEERVCNFLLSTARRVTQTCPAMPIVELPMTRLDIADYLGLTIETVSRTMTKLTNRGVIVAAGRHSVVIVKPVTLASLAGESYADPYAAPTERCLGAA